MVEEIKALKELLDMGAITQEEYDRKKREILDGSSNPILPVTASSTPTRPQYAPTSQVPQSKSKVAADCWPSFSEGWVSISSTSVTRRKASFCFS
ncbi:MAG: SHOCT domain-containing protein [Collinsella intestinalis]|uniref:SHOCT domain-containing protein n=1 Tax=Collinsella intestinalis TaxID=147207 RepID=UPI0012EC4123